jgi:hypothetical protein
MKEMPVHIEIPSYPVRLAIVKKTKNNKCWQAGRETGTLLYYWWECKPPWKSVMEAP